MVIENIFCITIVYSIFSEKAMAPHSSTLAWKIPWMEEPGRLQSMRLLTVWAHDWATSLSLFTFMHWRRKWQPTPVFLPWRIPGMAAVDGVAQSRTWLKWLSSSSSIVFSILYHIDFLLRKKKRKPIPENNLCSNLNGCILVEKKRHWISFSKNLCSRQFESFCLPNANTTTLKRCCCSHFTDKTEAQPWNSKMLAPWKKSYDQPRQHIKKQRHYFANKV